ncbi:MAG TPA: hypothetical protein VF518_00485 [Polyangia bacterium]
MNPLWLVLGGSVLLACVTHEASTSQPPLAPLDNTGPTRYGVDSGLVTLALDALDIVPGGGAGLFTPDAATPPDLASVLPVLDAGGIGASCDVFATPTTTPPTTCGTGLQCSPNPADGTGTCQQRGSSQALEACDLSGNRCGARLVCFTLNGTSSCTNLCRLGQPTAGYCSNSIGYTCARLGQSSAVGYCTTD